MSYILKNESPLDTGNPRDSRQQNKDKVISIINDSISPSVCLPPKSQAVEFCCNGCARRAKAYLKRYGVKIRLVKCSPECKYPHIGIVKNSNGKNIEALLLAGGFSKPGMQRGENGEFNMLGGVG